MNIKSRIGRGLLVALTAFLLLAGGFALHAQQPAGGSIKDFKHPANPKVYGGRIPKDTKPPSNPSGEAVDPASNKSFPGEPARSTAASESPKRIGGFRSKPRPGATALPSPANTAPQPAAEINTQLEDAIAAGNNARDARPPNYELAEKSYRVAAAIAPKDARPYEGLGNIFIDQKRYADAFEAYQQAVRLGSENPEVFESLGDSYLALGRFSEALEASNRSIALDPKRPGPYFTRAWLNLYIGRGGAAGDDAHSMLDRWDPPWAGEQPFYVAVVGYLGYRQAGRQDDANKLLDEAGKTCTSVAWVCQPIRYLRHEQTAEEFLGRANNNDRLTEAHTYIGVDLALAGRRADALPHLKWVEANGNKTFYEYPLALAWLKQ